MWPLRRRSWTWRYRVIQVPGTIRAYQVISNEIDRSAGAVAPFAAKPFPIWRESCKLVGQRSGPQKSGATQ
jgi:hypothetical protein